MENARFTMISSVVALPLCIIFVACVPTTNTFHHIKCRELLVTDLEGILGAAFNARYMSIKSPNIEPPENKKRDNLNLDFYVDSNYREDFEDEPAWSLTNHVEATMRRLVRDKRNVKFAQEWHCKARMLWTDLGSDYFPRYLRSVECLQDNCWYNMYKCRPKSFTVKVLRRRRGTCVLVDLASHADGDFNKDLQELWVWEERAVSFCCDCTL